MLNRAFKLVMKGAELIALHKGQVLAGGRQGYSLISAAFVTGLEYSTDTEATIIGKPSPSFFKLALQGKWVFPPPPRAPPPRKSPW